MAGGNNFERVDAVDLPGQFARRGGIIDIYAPLTSGEVLLKPPAIGSSRSRRRQPIRIDFFGEPSRASAGSISTPSVPRTRSGASVSWPPPRRWSWSSGSCSRTSCRRRRSSSWRSRTRSRRSPVCSWPAWKRPAGSIPGRISTTPSPGSRSCTSADSPRASRKNSCGWPSRASSSSSARPPPYGPDTRPPSKS